MLLTDRLKLVAAEAAAIKKNLEVYDANRPNASEGWAPEKGLRAIKLATGRNLTRVAECAKLLREVMDGTRPDWHLKEAMTTSDFPLLFGDVLYRQLMGYYKPWPITYDKYFKVIKLNDFRSLNMYAIDGGQGRLEQVAERAPYPETSFVETKRQIQVAKYGRRYSVTFEMMINDDLNAFNDRPNLMATGARRSEEYLATQQMFDANGPHASFFTSGNANIITGNPALGIVGLQAAYTQLATIKDADGEPILVDMATLVVPPALEITAQNMLNAIQIRLANNGGDSNELLYVQNWMKGRLQLAVNPYIPTIVTNGTRGNTSWLLVASPSDPSLRPAFVFGKLRGRENPQLFVKDPDQTLLGGGDTSPMEGNFDYDGIDYKLRHIFGAAQGDPKMAVSSNGTGS